MQRGVEKFDASGEPLQAGAGLRVRGEGKVSADCLSQCERECGPECDGEAGRVVST